jgi:hypothetical protein
VRGSGEWGVASEERGFTTEDTESTEGFGEGKGQKVEDKRRKAKATLVGMTLT